MGILHRLARRCRSCGGALRCFALASAGVAAVEFAMVLPVMVLIYLGTTELTFAVNTDRKLTLLSRTLADLTARAATVTGSQLDDIFGAALSVMAPYSTANVKMVITSVAVTAKSGGGVEGKVCWSRAKGTGATALAKNTIVPVPDGFQAANTSFIRAEVSMPYTPVFGSGVLNLVTSSPTLNLTESTPWPVRNVKEVVLDNTPCLT
ncbi:MAG TPA: TadE/TadG family type IV pilus assembly protein [Beijerinckiaceae bacterium]|nr:TadE/TadG family type IV pilus assembly protein [Beijerinckiaceae bacterium]